MDLSFTEDQKLIKDAARDVLKKECPSDLVREMERDEKGYPPALWQKIAELGWLRLIYPARYGGLDGNLMDSVVLLEEMGRYLVPIPFLPTVILGGLPILYGGTEKQKQEFLPKIANGELILSMAFTEPEPIYNATGINLRAIQEGDHFLIEGIKVFVPYAHVADYLICATRTKNSKNRMKREDGITLFLVDGKNPRASLTSLETIACDKQYEVVFNGINVANKSMIGKYHKGWEVLKKVFEQATIAHCALMVGGAERVLEMAVDYAKKRVQFNRPIGSFQAIQHRCTNMVADLDGAKSVTYEAAWKFDQGIPCTFEVSVAKAWVSQAYRRICANGHQIFGGLGLIKDQDMELYSRRAKAAEFFLGDTQFHREIIAKQLDL
jgi:alkylation response protein AidB-like acyl-CoA dehydrogenase